MGFGGAIKRLLEDLCLEYSAHWIEFVFRSIIISFNRLKDLIVSFSSTKVKPSVRLWWGIKRNAKLKARAIELVRRATGVTHALASECAKAVQVNERAQLCVRYYAKNKSKQKQHARTHAQQRTFVAQCRTLHLSGNLLDPIVWLRARASDSQRASLCVTHCRLRQCVRACVFACASLHKQHSAHSLACRGSVQRTLWVRFTMCFCDNNNNNNNNHTNSIIFSHAHTKLGTQRKEREREKAKSES